MNTKNIDEYDEFLRDQRIWWTRNISINIVNIIDIDECDEF